MSTRLEDAKKRAQGLCFAGGSLAQDHAMALDEIVAAVRAETLEKAAKWDALTDEQRQQVTGAIVVAYEAGDIVDERTYDTAIELLGGEP